MTFAISDEKGINVLTIPNVSGVQLSWDKVFEAQITVVLSKEHIQYVKEFVNKHANHFEDVKA